LWHVWKQNATPAVSKETAERKVAFFQHGLIDIAGTWWFNTPEISIASKLANEGWDLWFGNNRGTT